MKPELKKAIHELVVREIVTEISTTAGVPGYLTPYAFKGDRKDHPGVKFLIKMGWSKIDEAVVTNDYLVSQKVDKIVNSLIPNRAAVTPEERQSIADEIRAALEKVYNTLGITIQQPQQ